MADRKSFRRRTLELKFCLKRTRKAKKRKLFILRLLIAFVVFVSNDGLDFRFGECYENGKSSLVVNNIRS